MLIRKILFIGACDSELILSRFKMEEVSVIGGQKDREWLWGSLDIDFVQKMKEVRVAAVIYDEIGEGIFKRFVRLGIPVILVLPTNPRKAINSFVRKLIEKGAKGIFLDNFAQNPLAIEEFYRQVSKLAV